MDWDTVLKEFISLWVVIDLIGSVPVFIAVTAAVLLFFLVGGQILLEGVNIHLEAFQIAGGIVLFLFALTMIFGESKIEEEKKQISASHSHLAVFPLAVPSLASPGAMLAVVMLTDNHRYSITEQFFTAGAMLAVLASTLVLFFLAGPIQRLIGDSGASIVSRVMGLVLASVAVDNVLLGLSSYFNLG